jgi:hypothetical protein
MAVVYTTLLGRQYEREYPVTADQFNSIISTYATVVVAPSQVQLKLTTNASYYVNASAAPASGRNASGPVTFGGGSDSTGDGSLAKPWLTLQHAYASISDSVNFNGFTATVYLAHGSSTNYSLSAVNGPFVGQSVLNVVGDSSDQTLVTVVAPAGSFGAQIKDLSCLDYSYVSFADNGSSNGAGHVSTGVGNYGHLDIGNCSFGAINTAGMIHADYSSSITFTGPIKFTGNAGVALLATNGGVIDTSGQTVTLVGTPAFSTCFAYIVDNGVIEATPSTFSGAATGQKYQIHGNPTLTSYNPDSVFPGSIDGSLDTRIKLTAATTFYVGTNGNDANDGLSTGTPWATFAHAMTKITGYYDFGGQTVTLQVVAGSGNYTERLTLSPWIGGGSFIFDGGGKTINYAGVVTNDGAIFLQGSALPGIATIQNVTITTTQGASSLVTGVFVQSASSLKIGTGVTFGANFSAHILALNPGSIIFLAASLTISGNATYGFFVNGGVIRVFSTGISITFSVAVSISPVTLALNSGLISLPTSLVTWVNPGNVTGQRYAASTNGIVTSQGGGLNFIPGTIAGVVSSGGQYT